MAGVQLAAARRANSSLWARIRYETRLILRSLKIFFLFLPTVLTFPLYYFFRKHFEEYWLKLLLWSIEASGSVVVKLAQYASHRPDIIDAELAQRL
jgi:aarF domain-containing kinase